MVEWVGIMAIKMFLFLVLISIQHKQRLERSGGQADYSSAFSAAPC